MTIMKRIFVGAALASLMLALPATAADRKPLVSVGGVVKQLPSGDMLLVTDDAYDATGWNGSSQVPTKNAVRDKIEAMIAGGTYTDEQAEDAVGGILTDTGTVDFTYNDGANTISAIVPTGSIGATQIASTAVTPGSYTAADITVDADGRITAAANGAGGGGSYTAENARDDIGTALVAGSGITITPNDGADTITVAQTRPTYFKMRLMGPAVTSGAFGTTTVNVNSTSYVAASGFYFTADLDAFPFTHYRITGLGQSNAAGQTVTGQLATFASPGTGIHSGGNDTAAIGNSTSSLDSGWKTRDDGLTTGLIEYGVVWKGSNSTVDVSINYLEIEFKIN